MRAAVLCVLAASALAVSQLPAVNLYCGKGGYTGAETDCLGSFAVNGNFSAKDWAGGSSLTPGPVGSQNTGIIQGDATFINAQIYNGNLVVCGQLSQSALSVSGGSIISNCDSFDFAGTNAFLTQFSATYAALPPTGAPTRVDNEFTFLSNPDVSVNVYLVPANLFDAISEMTIDAPKGAWVIINVDSAAPSFENFEITLSGGITPNYIIYNFYEATTLTVQNVGVEGSVIAPAAATSFNNGHIDGSFYVASITGNGEAHYFPPVTPVVPSPTPCPCPTASPVPFPQFSAFAINNINSQNSDDLGYMAAGGNIALLSYSINMNSTVNASCPNALVSGGSITYTNGEVKGNIVAGTSLTLSSVSLLPQCSKTANAGPNAVLNFAAAAANLKSVSNSFGARTATNPTVRMYQEITLQTGATASGISVFTFPSSLLAGCSSLTIIAPAGQLVLINVPGTSNTIADFQINLNGGVTAANVLWNYFQSTSVNINNVYVQGTTLAPYATVNFSAGQLHGALYADSITGGGEYHPQPPFVPVCPCPTQRW